MDLVEVNPNVRPIVCKIMDYGRHKYEQQKSQKKTKQASTDLKQIITISPGPNLLTCFASPQNTRSISSPRSIYPHTPTP